MSERSKAQRAMHGRHHLLRFSQLGPAVLTAAVALAVSTPAGAAPPSCAEREPAERSVLVAKRSLEPRITLPCVITGVVDGDTLDCELRLVVRVRLVADADRGAWAPESRTTDQAEKKLGLAAKANLEKLALGKEGLLSVPIRSPRLVDALTLERVLGEVIVDGKSLGAVQIRQGHASSTKGGRLGQ